jgi:hypothetical protein
MPGVCAPYNPSYNCSLAPDVCGATVDTEPIAAMCVASASPQECLGIILGAPGSSPAPEATLERGAPSKGSYTTGLEEVH